MIRVFDGYGRELFITKQAWRESVLLPQIQKRWSDPNGADAPPFYQVPANTEFPYYLLRLERLLAVRCCANAAANSTGLSGEREILDGNLQLCLNHPLNVTTRIVFYQTLTSMKHIRPQAVEEFRDKVQLLQKEKPLSEPARGVVQRLVNEVFAS